MDGSNPPTDHHADVPGHDAAWRRQSRAILLTTALGSVVLALWYRYERSASGEYDPPSRWTVESRDAACEPFAAPAARAGCSRPDSAGER